MSNQPNSTHGFGPYGGARLPIIALFCAVIVSVVLLAWYLMPPPGWSGAPPHIAPTELTEGENVAMVPALMEITIWERHVFGEAGACMADESDGNCIARRLIPLKAERDKMAGPALLFMFGYEDEFDRELVGTFVKDGSSDTIVEANGLIHFVDDPKHFLDGVKQQEWVRVGTMTVNEGNTVCGVATNRGVQVDHEGICSNN